MKLFEKIYHRFLSRYVECARLYKLNLQQINPHVTGHLPENFEFAILRLDSLEKMRGLYQNCDYRLAVAKERLDSENYICFAYIDKRTHNIAYTRWVSKHKFYSETLRKELSFAQNEVLTLDSWTHPEYRNMGLHRNMNIDMLLWLKQNTTVEYVYMIIKCFNSHLTKVPRELGYKPIKTVVWFRQNR